MLNEQYKNVTFMQFLQQFFRLLALTNAKCNINPNCNNFWRKM